MGLNDEAIGPFSHVPFLQAGYGPVQQGRRHMAMQYTFGYIGRGYGFNGSTMLYVGLDGLFEGVCMVNTSRL